MANRVHACLRTVFNKAIEWGCIQTKNPCTGIKHHKERPRRRKLGMNEVSRFLKALEDEKYAEYARYFFTVSLYHGLREPEVLGAKCSELDMDNNTWLIPADRTKENEDHIVQLTERTKDIFHSLLVQAKVNKTEFLFYNKKTKKPYQLTDELTTKETAPILNLAVSTIYSKRARNEKKSTQIRYLW